VNDRRYTAHSFEEAARDKVADEIPGADLGVFAATFDLIRLSTRVMHDLESSVHRPAGWSYAGFRVMFTVWVAGSLPPMDIAHLSGLSRAAVSSVVNTLERDGLVTRSRESDDRRVVTVRLTEEGERRLAETYAEQNARSGHLWRDLSPQELATFADLCRRALGTRRQSD
jgi:DNA-binding MarR family transcriptional regulator